MKKQNEQNDGNFTAGRNTPGFWREAWHQARLIYALMLDPDVPTYLKIIPFGALAYLVMPLDLIPDFALGLGQLDDLTVLLVLSKVFVDLAPAQSVAKHKDQIRVEDGFDPSEGKVTIDQEVADQVKISEE